MFKHFTANIMACTHLFIADPILDDLLSLSPSKKVGEHFESENICELFCLYDMNHVM